MAETDRDKLIQAWFEGTQNMQRTWKHRFHAEMTKDSNESLSMGQLGLMFYLQEQQPVSSKQIAADTHNSKSAVAQLLDALDQAGMIIRQADPTDRRIAYVSLTKSGTDKVRGLSERRKAFFMELAESLTDHELEVMIGVQRKMLQHIQTRQEAK